MGHSITPNKRISNNPTLSEAVALDSIGITGTLKKSKNKKRYSLRRKFQSNLIKINNDPLWAKPLKTCGRGVNSAHGGTAKINIQNGNAYVSNTNRCKSWNCPYCAPVKGYTYGEKIREITQKHLDNNLRVSLITLTTGFKRSATTEERLELLIATFSKVKKAIKRKYRNFEYARRLEFTINVENAFTHHHIHSLFYFDDGVNEELQNKIANEFILKWISEITRAGYKINANAQRHDVITSNEGIARYLSKTLGYEMTSSGTKKGKGINFFDFLEDEKLLSERKRRRIISDVLDGTHGRRLMTFSKGLNVKEEELEKEEDNNEALIDDVKEEVEEIEMPISCAEALIKVHTSEFYFKGKGVFVEDVLHEIATNKSFKNEFEAVCEEAFELWNETYDAELIADTFLFELYLLWFNGGRVKQPRYAVIQ